MKLRPLRRPRCFLRRRQVKSLLQVSPLLRRRLLLTPPPVRLPLPCPLRLLLPLLFLHLHRLL